MSTLPADDAPAAAAAVDTPTWVADDAALDAAVEALLAVDRYALDTEFQGERSYFPRLALVQLCDGEHIWLVDPFACDVRRLAALLDGPGTMLAHAARQDLEILQREVGTLPARMIDTQVVAAFAGEGSQALASLCRSLVGVKLEKGDRLTDWTARPLRASARRYAASDVAYLHAIVDALQERLTEERWQWALDECETQRVPPEPADPDCAWWRVRGARALKGERAKVAQAVAAWREHTARSRNIPARAVLGDLALESVVSRMPTSEDELRGCRGVGNDPRTLATILRVIDEGRRLPNDALRRPPDEPDDRGLGAAVALAVALVTQRARALGLDPQMVATRADVAAAVAGRSGRLDRGWRATVVGDLVHRLVDGQLTLRLADGGRTLVVDDTV